MLLHFGFLLFAVLGGLLALRWRAVAWLHLACLAWAALMVFRGWTCPLTPLEQRLRRDAGEPGWSEGFIDHYITSRLQSSGLTHPQWIRLVAALLVFNALVYALVLWRIRARAG